MHPQSLKNELSTHLIFQTKLREAYPDFESDELKDTIEGLTNLPEMLAALLRSYLDDNCSVKALKLRIDDLRERQKRIELRVEKKRALAAEVMAEAEMPKLNRLKLTANLKGGTVVPGVSLSNAMPTISVRTK